MLVHFRKNPPASSADEVSCLRPDGTTTVGDMPRQGLLPRAAFHFVVETTLGWRDAFFGQIARGAALATLTHRPPSAQAPAPATARARQSEALVDCLQANQWGGTPAPEIFFQTLADACRRHHVPAPALSTDELARLRAALKAFGAEWRPLLPGKTIERHF